jgi:Zn-dependent protease/predicted transcriptional regulator
MQDIPQEEAIMSRGVHIGRVAGIRLALDWTVLFIFGLVVLNLGVAGFRVWHPNWSSGLVWGLSIAAGLLLLVSILAHELAHALVARGFGIQVRSITLFIFGGVTDIERDPSSPRAEALMALVGPLTSLIIGFVCIAAVSGMTQGWQNDLNEPTRVLQQLGPGGTLLAWLGPLNIVLGLFNLVPGFPLDGGRVLRAAIWKVSGSLHRATRWASYSGRAVAWALIAIGALMLFGVRVPFFGTGFGGLWLVIIGWFLHSAAEASYRQLLVRDLLEGVRVGQFLREPRAVVPPDLAVDQLVDHLMSGRHRAFAVGHDTSLEGIVTVADVRRVPRSDWSFMRIDQIMTPASRLHALKSDDDLYAALETMSRTGVAQLPVMDRGEFRGFVLREDIGRWLELQIANGHSGNGPHWPAVNDSPRKLTVRDLRP